MICDDMNEWVEKGVSVSTYPRGFPELGLRKSRTLHAIDYVSILSSFLMANGQI